MSKCPECGEDFPSKGNRKYCSLKCGKNAKQKREERFTKSELDYYKSFLKQLILIVTEVEYEKKVREMYLLLELQSKLMYAGYRIQSIVKD